jgi:hypothetical protein
MAHSDYFVFCEGCGCKLLYDHDDESQDVAGQVLAGLCESCQKRGLFLALHSPGNDPEKVKPRDENGDEVVNSSFACPSCGSDISDVLFEEPWFRMTGGHPGDSGPGGNTPQDPVAEGVQECPDCNYEWEVMG